MNSGLRHNRGREERGVNQKVVRAELPGGKGKETHLVREAVDKFTRQTCGRCPDGKAAHGCIRRGGRGARGDAIDVERGGAASADDRDMRPDVENHRAGAKPCNAAEERLDRVPTLLKAPAAGSGVPIVNQSVVAGGGAGFDPRLQAEVVRDTR